jgi:hypothetical protein
MQVLIPDCYCGGLLLQACWKSTCRIPLRQARQCSSRRRKAWRKHPTKYSRCWAQDQGEQPVALLSCTPSSKSFLQFVLHPCIPLEGTAAHGFDTLRFWVTRGTRCHPLPAHTKPQVVTGKASPVRYMRSTPLYTLLTYGSCQEVCVGWSSRVHLPADSASPAMLLSVCASRYVGCVNITVC